jgi:hypothetical protein
MIYLGAGFSQEGGERKFFEVIGIIVRVTGVKRLTERWRAVEEEARRRTYTTWYPG